MKILYGVQGTGNGHITRARVMAPLLRKASLDVTYVLSGRPREKLFDMEPFGDYQWYRGLTFTTRTGKVSYLRTSVDNNLIQFGKDVSSLDMSEYDLVITDFEPVTAWAAKTQKAKAVIGLGHQYAFPYSIPVTGDNLIARAVMRYFAPAQTGIGLHWHHFDQPILPPIIEVPEKQVPIKANKIIVYLPFENPDQVVTLLREFRAYQFYVYTAADVALRADNVHIRQLCRDGFQADLHNSIGVICNAGFELSSESLQLGKKLLVKPLHAQMEQLSNALALAQLGYGSVMHTLDPKAIAAWLEQTSITRVHYPNTAAAVVQWLAQGDWQVTKDWVRDVWSQVEISREDYPAEAQAAVAAAR